MTLCLKTRLMLDQPKSMRAQVIEYGLIVDPSFLAATEAETDAVFNGCGPDKFSPMIDRVITALTGASDPDAKGRELLSIILSAFLPTFYVHDWDCRTPHPSSTKVAFHVANKRMMKNMNIIIAAKYPLWKLWRLGSRAYWWTLARVAFDAVDGESGWSAWND